MAYSNGRTEFQRYSSRIEKDKIKSKFIWRIQLLLPQLHPIYEWISSLTLISISCLWVEKCGSVKTFENLWKCDDVKNWKCEKFEKLIVFGLPVKVAKAQIKKVNQALSAATQEWGPTDFYTNPDIKTILDCVHNLALCNIQASLSRTGWTLLMFWPSCPSLWLSSWPSPLTLIRKSQSSNYHPWWEIF